MVFLILRKVIWSGLNLDSFQTELKGKKWCHICSILYHQRVFVLCILYILYMQLKQVQ